MRTSYGDERYSRPLAIKDKYDPTNLFSLNQSIAPSNGARLL